MNDSASIPSLAINLDSRPERWNAFLTALPSDWPFDRPKRFSAVDLRHTGAAGGEDGCRESHLRAIQHVASSGRDTLIMEDDCRWTPKIRRVAEAIKNLPADWDCAWLGGYQDPIETSEPTVAPQWLRARGLTKTHAIYYRAESAEKVHEALSTDTSHNAIDMRYLNVMRSDRLKIYRLSPWAAWQCAGPSDTANIDRLRADFWVWEDAGESCHSDIHPHGFYLTDEPSHFDEPLALAIAEIVAGRVIDLGCGHGDYVQFLQGRGLDAIGLEGNPHAKNYGEHVAIANLTRPLEVLPADWVISLEVGEHIPARFMHNFLNNVSLLAKQGVVLSWAVPGQGGLAHVNELPNDKIISLMRERDWKLNAAMQSKLRAKATLPWFRESLMAFER